MNEKAGLYFHIPFCKSKCPYCDFYSKKYCRGDDRIYCERLIKEIEKYSGEFDSVYFGGGTPSIIEPALIGKILDAARDGFDIDSDSEITIECNPREDLSECFKQYARFGINRVSLGMQSAVDKERFALGRSAGRTEVERAIKSARASGIENISLDLMLGIPNQTLDTLDESLDFIDKMKVQHVSAYMLKIEEGTKFFELRDKLALPDDELVSRLYLKTVKALNELGIKQYEISNFARDGFESRHNTKYWKLVPYLGIGKTAHSFWGGRRFYYDRNFNIINDGEGGDENERIMLGLRLNKGIDKSLLRKPYKQFLDMEYMTESENRVSLTPEGMLVSNTIINELI